jgi:sugar lactone lactonase YvrE
MKRALRCLLTAFCAASCVASCPAWSDAAVAARCEATPDRDGQTAYCGIPAPEDLVLFDGRFLISSSMAPGRHLYGLDTTSGEVRRLETGLDAVPAAENWGDAACAPPSLLESHGLDLRRRADGRWQLLVVNHAQRESVEFFEVGSAGELPALRWRGCVPAAENAQFNDVAGLPDGGFLATDPITASWQLPRMLLGSLGMNTGQVYRWRPREGYAAVPNTRGAYPNGITLGADGKRFYLNLYLDGEVREHDLESGEVLRRVEIAKPDNGTLADDGTLLVASHDAALSSLLAAIVAPPEKRNTIPFDIVVVSLDDFRARRVFRSDGAALGGGTVAQPVGAHLYIGAFRGDRILRVPWAPATLNTGGTAGE